VLICQKHTTLATCFGYLVAITQHGGAEKHTPVPSPQRTTYYRRKPVKSDERRILWCMWFRTSWVPIFWMQLSIKFLTQTQISSVPNTVISVRFKKVIPNLMTASILTTFLRSGVWQRTISISYKHSDQWSFERLRRPDDGYWVAETCHQYSLFLTINSRVVLDSIQLLN
jgi:hypothetical protein